MPQYYDKEPPAQDVFVKLADKLNISYSEREGMLDALAGSLFCGHPFVCITKIGNWMETHFPELWKDHSLEQILKEKVPDNIHLWRWLFGMDSWNDNCVREAAHLGFAINPF